MRLLRAISLGAWLSCVAASNAAAAPPGINLSWSDCGTFGQDTRVFACDTNVGNHTLVGSFSSPVALDSLYGNEVVMDVLSSAAVIPPWWQLKNYNDGTVGCRNGTFPAGSSSFNFTVGPFNCHDYWQGLAAGGRALFQIIGLPSGVRVRMVCAIQNEQTVPLEAELETYSFKLIISNSKTVGVNACAGCMDQADIVLKSIKLYQPDTGINHDVLLTQPSTRNYVYWRPGVVATRNASWGAIKSMYR